MSSSDTTSVDLANNVGQSFVKTYYEMLFSDPLSLYKLYKSESRYSRGASSEAPTVVQGVNEIKQQIENLKFNSPLVLLSDIDIQPTLSGGILISVVGSFRNGNENEQTRPFNEVFVLAPQKPKGFYIYTHTFRFVDNFVDDFVTQNPRNGAEFETYEESSSQGEQIESEQIHEELPTHEEKEPEPEEEPKKSVPQEEPIIREPEPTQPAKPLKEEPRVDTSSPRNAPKTASQLPPAQPSGPKTWRDIVNLNTFTTAPVTAAAAPAVKPVSRPPATKPATEPVAAKPAAEKPKPASGSGSGSGHLQAPQKMVVVRHISQSSTSESIKKALSKHGNILSAQLSGRLAFVEFENVASVAKALAAQEPVIVDGVEVKLEPKRNEKSTKRAPGSAENRNSPPTRVNKPRNAPRSGNLRDSDKSSN